MSGGADSFFWGLLALVVLASCNHEVDPRRVTLRSEGSLCLGAPGGGAEGGAPAGVDLAAGQPLVIGVRSPCLSNVCATERASKCVVKREGDRLVVASELTWIGPEDIGRPCPQDCTFLEAQCTTESLPAGSYKVVVGTRTTEVTLPSHLDVRCESDRPQSRVSVTPVAAAAPPPPVAATPAKNVDPSFVPAAPGTGVVAEPPPGDTICIGPATAGAKSRALKAGQPIAVTVLHRNLCLGASCTKAPGKCTAKRKGFDIVVSAQFPTSTTRPTQPCTEDCSAIAATCRTDGLPRGSYTIALGDQKRTLEIPAASAPACGP
ncbi:hypothetical protein BH11MYX4_BH11MYX4_40020 [soil metagenome]